MPYKSMTEVPAQLKGAGLSLSQANDWARYYDSAKKQESIENPAGIAWTRFKSKYKKQGDKWIMKQKHSMNTGTGKIVFNSMEDGVCNFSFIVNSEGIHQGLSGIKVKYTKEFFDTYGASLVMKRVYDDPKHYNGEVGIRKIGDSFAVVKSVDVKQINSELAKEFGIDEKLVGRYALIANAEGYKQDYNYLLRNNQIQFYSSELMFRGDKLDDIWTPSWGSYDGVVALSNPGADPGAVMLNIYNMKYKMEDIDKLKEELETQKTLNAELQEKADEAEKAEEVKAGMEKENEEAKVENAKLQEKIKELSASEEGDDEKLGKLSAQNDELGKKVLELEENEKIVNAKLKEMRDDTRTQLLSKETSNEDVVKGIIEQDLDEEAFNAKIEEIKTIKEEAKAEFEKQSNSAGIAPIGDTEDGFEKFWGGKPEDLVKEIVGG